MFPFSSKETTRESVLFGVIGSYISQDVSHLEDAFRRGIRVWRICVPWDLYEPVEGFFDPEYVRKTEAYMRKITEAGLNVEVQLSFQNPPPWVFTYPGSRFRNQFGDEWIQEPSSGKNTANAVFNPHIRRIQSNTMEAFFRDFGTDFWTVDLSIGIYGEVSYPEADFRGEINSYWAFDEHAQAWCPVPGWIPGEASENNSSARIFANWYLDSMIDYVRWQIEEIRKHYSGRINCLFGGWGLRADWLEDAIASDLSGSTFAEYPAELVQRGLDFRRLIESIDDDNFSVCCTWMDPDPRWYDDDSPREENWSPPKYLSQLAESNSFSYFGENGGAKSFVWSFENLKRCGYGCLTWLNEEWLWEDPSRIEAFENEIKRYGLATNQSISK